VGLVADIATLNDIHAAYIRGSVPTAAQESDDIMNQPFSDEVRLWSFGGARGGQAAVW
jgi:hypothetical protein